MDPHEGEIDTARHSKDQLADTAFPDGMLP